MRQRLLRRALVTVRALVGADRPSVRALLEANGLPTADLQEDTIRLLGLQDGNGLAGVVGLELHDEVALLRSLAVRSDLRGTGVGSSLVQAAEQAAGRSGVRQVFLLTTTAESFFSRRGYTRHDRAAAPNAIKGTAEFASLCPASAAFMVKHLVTTRPAPGAS